MPVSTASSGLSPKFSRSTRHTAYELFTPNNSGQRSHPTYYRGCWHVVGRCFFSTYRHPKASSMAKEVYNPKAVIPHAASLRQASAHCAIFPTAASRRSLGRVSVPVWPVALSGRLPVVALVGHHPTNKLIGRGPIPSRKTFHHTPCSMKSYPVLDPVSQAYPRAEGRSPTCYSPVRRSCTPKRALPLDLHVLSTPPAFVLSQDQTLQQKLAQQNRPRQRSQPKNKLAQKPIQEKARHTVEFSKDTRTPSTAARRCSGAVYPPYTSRS